MQSKNLISKMGSVAKSFLGLDAGFGIQTEFLNASNYNRSGQAFGNNGWLFDAGGPGIDVHFSYSGLSDVIRAYECCPPVFSIVNKQAYAFVNGKTWITKSDGVNKGKEATGDYANKVKNLLYNPNALQNGKQFEAQAAIYLRLFGYCIILPIKPVGFPNSEASALWIIPPYMCELTFAKQTFFNLKKGFISSIVVKYGNETSTLNPEDVIILRDIAPSFNNLFLPESPIKPLQKNISNLIGIYNSKGMLINYRGSLGILSPEKDPAGTIPLTTDEIKDMQDGLMRYGLKSGQWKFIFSNSSVKWQSMSIPYNQLMLTEWGEDDLMVVCDGLNYPFRLLSSTKTSSMAGTEVEAFKKILYQDFVIPFSEMIYEQLDEAFEADENKCCISKDFSHITVLQEDKFNKGRAILAINQGLLIQWQQNILTANEWRTIMEQDPLPVDGDLYYDDWVKAGKTFSTTPAPVAADPNAQSSTQTPAA